jgi:hypothetical protein
MGLNIGFSALETMLAMLEYSRVCAMWGPQMLTQEHEDHQMQVCQDLLDCPTTPTIYSRFGASRLPSDRVDERWTT